MIQLSINGNTQAFAAPLSLTHLVEQLGFAGKRLAVELNGEIVPRSQHADTQLADGDTLEIVVAVGGG
ncbi:sulfur carrier protein ThiS [Chitiniphilus shinanonensis]|uniref:sulfur carrier protein ThiS n=1 Tax=Chitiniphilus shinanonensis TaxID=553088 RepID=UPI00035C4172|nr:sulfur carrier protein ThiS [Chitiniphilus shinanonensis]